MRLEHEFSFRRARAEEPEGQRDGALEWDVQSRSPGGRQNVKLAGVQVAVEATGWTESPWWQSV